MQRTHIHIILKFICLLFSLTAQYFRWKMMKYDMFGPTKYVIKVSFICINHIEATDINNYCRIHFAYVVCLLLLLLLFLFTWFPFATIEPSNIVCFTHTPTLYLSILYILVVLFGSRAACSILCSMVL